MSLSYLLSRALVVCSTAFLINNSLSANVFIDNVDTDFSVNIAPNGFNFEETGADYLNGEARVLGGSGSQAFWNFSGLEVGKSYDLFVNWGDGLGISGSLFVYYNIDLDGGGPMTSVNIPGPNSIGSFSHQLATPSDLIVDSISYFNLTTFTAESESFTLIATNFDSSFRSMVADAALITDSLGVIPEPSTMTSFVGLVSIGFLGMRRRRIS